MNTDNGRLFYATGIDNSQLRSDAAESRNILASIGQTAVQEGNKMDATFGRIAKAAGGVFAVGQIKEFTSNIIQLRGEIESFEISFNTLLGSDIKGSAMFKDIREFAVNTPMMLKDLASGAQTMLAFNIEAEKVMPMLRAIGDISMGDAQKFNSLTLAFSQMSATGKLMGQDLLQMINAGFNPLSVISEKTGKSIGELKEEMEKGKITTEMVTEAFISATSAGGKFYGMLEKQSKGTQGAISNLQGAIDDMYNDLGTAAQGATVEVIGGATTIVKHYKEIAEILAVIVGTYGAYKAALIATEAVRRSVTAIKHTEEAAQIYAVMTAEQKAKISKLGLAETSEAYRAAVIAEMKTEMERQIQLAQTTQVELTAARERLATAESAKVAAAEKVASRQAEVEAAYASAAADQQSSTIKKIAAESEAQSRAALLAVKLEEQKNAAIAQARALKEAGASQEVIAAKNREIATISEKIATARAEEVQHSRNIVALRKEMAAQVDATTSKKIATAEAALETAQEELNTASKVRNTAAREVQSKAAAVNTAVRKAGTIETALDTAAETANATATGFLSAAKTKLTAVAAKLNAVIMANPWAIAAAAVVALGYGIYKLITYQTDAEKAQERLNKVNEDFNATCASEQIQIDTLFTRLKNAKEGTQEYKDAKDAILSQYGSYLQGLNNEIATLKDVEAAYKAVKQAALEAARARAMEAAVKGEADAYGQAEGEQMKKLQEALKKRYGNKKNKSGQLLYLDYFDQLKRHIQNGGTIATLNADWLKGWDVKHEKYLPGDPMTNIGAQTLTYTTNEIIEIYSKIGKARKVYGDALAQAEVMYGKAPEKKSSPAAKVKTEAQYNKKDWEDYKKTKQAEYDAMTEAERTSKKGRALAAEILRADQKVQGSNVIGNAKSAATAANKAEAAAERAQREQNQIAVQTAERNQKIKEYAESVIKTQREAEFNIRQNEIDLLKDGVEKELKQVELNYDRLVFANQQRRAEMLEGIRDLKELEWENANPTAKKNGLTFDRSSVSDDYLSDANVAALREQGKNAEADRLQGMLDQLKAYSRIATEIRAQGEKEALDKMLGDVLTYEQQRLKITEEYTRKRDALYEKNEDGTFKTDADGNKVMRKGVTQGNLDELDRQETEALKAVDEQFASREETYQAWCEEIANLSLKQLNAVLEQAKKNLDELEKSGTADPQQLAQARAKVATAQTAVNKANAKNQTNPGKRTIKEWEDLYKTLNEVEKEFESMGDTIGGTVGEIISECGQFASSTLTMINGIVQLVQMSSTSMQATAVAGASAISTMEKASVILTIISAALQIAMQIASLFNDDEEKQKEIEHLQERIDQLQWELDHQEIGRVQQQYGTAIDRLNKTLWQTKVELAAGAAGWQKWWIYFMKASDSQVLMQKTAEKLAQAYGSMSYTADKALGGAKYQQANEQLKNLAQQQILLQEQINAESSKKDSDSGQIQEWKNKIEELGQQSIELINDMVEDIIGDTSTGIAEELADAFFEAFQAGEDAAEAWGEKVNEIVADVLKRMLISKFLEEPLGDIFNKYKAKWFKDGQFQGLDSVINSMQGFANDLNAVGADFAAIWENLPDSVKNMFTVTSDAEREASQKGIATADQDSIDELNGRMTAVQGHTFSISENTKAILAITQAILRSVMNIETETEGFGARLQRMENNIQEMTDTLDDIATKGIKLKP